MSCSASNVVTRSYPVPVNDCAGATSKVTRSLTPAASARARAFAIEPLW